MGLTVNARHLDLIGKRMHLMAKSKHGGPHMRKMASAERKHHGIQFQEQDMAAIVFFAGRNHHGTEHQEQEAVAMMPFACTGDHQKFQYDSTLIALLKTCAAQKDLSKGSKLHADIVERGLLKENIFVGNTLVNMYAKCGALEKAKQVFTELPVRNVVSWNALITGYAQHGHGEEALACFQRMQGEGLSPSAVTFACLVKACGNIRAADRGEELHAEVARMGILEKDIVLGSALVDMYAKCGVLTKAQEVFDELSIRNVVSWTALIIGYCQLGHDAEALTCFEQMSREGLSPDAVSLACILKACGSAREADKGERVHAEIIRKGLLGNDTVLSSALVDMYARCGVLTKAQEVFNDLPIRDVIPWSALIAGYCENGHGEEALNCFEQMIHEGLFPDAVTFACILKACGSIGAAEKGKGIHSEVLRTGLLGKGIALGNALVDMYAKCGILASARQVFDELHVRDVISWTALIAGYCQHGHCEEALNCFERMKGEGLFPNTVTLACILKACGSLGAAEKGEEIHVEIVRKGLLGNNTVMGGALVDMYAKCGVLEKAREVCEQLPNRDVVSWSALIGGCCEYGHGEEAFNCFEQMKREGFSPDAVTFASVLKACGRMGAAEKGQIYFESMNVGYGIIPTLEHYTCMVDLYCHAGLLDKAMAVIKKMPSFDYFPAWCAVMGACGKWGNVKLGRMAFEQAI